MGTDSRVDLARARWLSAQLDRRYIDPILGFLLPGLGDLLTSSLGLYVLYLAWRGGASKALLARMLINLAIDASLGSMPLVGDIFDVFFKANERNIALWERRERSPTTSSPRDIAFLVVAIALFMGALILPVLALLAVVRWLF